MKFILLLIFIQIPLFVLLFCGSPKSKDIEYTDSNGNRVKLHILEKGKGKPIIFVHGAFNHEVWKKQFNSERLKNYRLITYDLRGHGKSVKFRDEKKAPAQYSLKLNAEDLAHIIQALDLKDAVVVGWSLGGHIILKYLADNPEPKISKAMILGATPALFGLNSGPLSQDFPAANPKPPLGFLFKNFLLHPPVSEDTAQKLAAIILSSDPDAGLNMDFQKNPDSESFRNMGISKEEIAYFARIHMGNDPFARQGMLDGFYEALKNVSEGKRDIPAGNQNLKNIYQAEMCDDVARFRTPLKILINENDINNNEQILYMKKLNYEFVTVSQPYRTGHSMFFSKSELFENELLSFIE